MAGSHIPGQGLAVLVHEGAQPARVTRMDKQVLHPGGSVQQHVALVAGQAVALPLRILYSAKEI